MSKRIFTIVALVAVFVLGVIITRWFYRAEQKEIIESQSTILLDKVRDVMKLVTVEANFNELYNETRTRPVTLYLPLPSTFNFDKKAILEVRGKVLVGYDLEAVKITADSTDRVLRLSNLPEPEILSIDHQVAFRNLEESWFNSFTAEDYTSLSANAKEVLRKKVIESQLLDRARDQGNRMIDVIRFMAESAGWTVELEPGIGEELKVQIDSILR
ncbi:DUF4230 domain-containing protein [Flavilitoribacter nigricans]|uniref:DUF4230 domain-containing protein n=1 Tax=Flavilitoribacter nigricans (strain ATCC 23147 / DSM 23189 / NBRC 102662 / NCIMB 1420 / SS-2) TaxID=1122177 RepID=A0A2D0NHR1_FLAN2|nr:DUF4230 domain-containing protein [Flavilitoribacter nigricans]PHN08035.1 hypothetical protein CRP01_03195 [Flavilitoribacter nigricans DSM 23189 = NBRC 102662]